MTNTIDTPLPGGWRKEDATSAEVVDATIYRQLVGSLMYLVNTRPDICYAVNQLSQAMVKPTKLFWKAGKHVLRYLRGTSGYGLWYKQSYEVKLHGFMDADWAGSPTDRKSTSGGIFSIESIIVSWYFQSRSLHPSVRDHFSYCISFLGVSFHSFICIPLGACHYLTEASLHEFPSCLYLLGWSKLTKFIKFEFMSFTVIDGYFGQK